MFSSQHDCTNASTPVTCAFRSKFRMVELMEDTWGLRERRHLFGGAMILKAFSFFCGYIVRPAGMRRSLVKGYCSCFLNDHFASHSHFLCAGGSRNGAFRFGTACVGVNGSEHIMKFGLFLDGEQKNDKELWEPASAGAYVPLR